MVSRYNGKFEFGVKINGHRLTFRFCLCCPIFRQLGEERITLESQRSDLEKKKRRFLFGIGIEIDRNP